MEIYAEVYLKSMLSSMQRSMQSSTCIEVHKGNMEGYLPIATIDLVGDHREIEVWFIF